MPLRLVQLRDSDERRIVAAAGDDGVARRVDGFETSYSLARSAIDREVTLAETVAGCSSAPELFHRPGDVHAHFFGTATLSFADGVSTEEGDVFEVSAAPFAIPLRNRLVRATSADATVLPL